MSFLNSKQTGAARQTLGSKSRPLGVSIRKLPKKQFTSTVGNDNDLEIELEELEELTDLESDVLTDTSCDCSVPMSMIALLVNQHGEDATKLKFHDFSSEDNQKAHRFIELALKYKKRN